LRTGGVSLQDGVYLQGRAIMAKKANPNVEMFREKGGEPIYTALVAGLKARIGAANATEDLKQTCVHINAGEAGTAYLGLHPRKGGLLVNIQTEKPIPSPRVRKGERVSKNRCHCEVVLTDPGQVDDELTGWLEGAWRCVAKK
jgi:hypothetical protein